MTEAPLTNKMPVFVALFLRSNDKLSRSKSLQTNNRGKLTLRFHHFVYHLSLQFYNNPAHVKKKKMFTDSKIDQKQTISLLELVYAQEQAGKRNRIQELT